MDRVVFRNPLEWCSACDLYKAHKSIRAILELFRKVVKLTVQNEQTCMANMMVRKMPKAVRSTLDSLIAPQ